MTFPRLLKLLLMFLVSFRRSPLDPELLRRSDPARSIRFKVPGGMSEEYVRTEKHPTIGLQRAAT